MIRIKYSQNIAKILAIISVLFIGLDIAQGMTYHALTSSLALISFLSPFILDRLSQERKKAILPWIKFILKNYYPILSIISCIVILLSNSLTDSAHAQFLFKAETFAKGMFNIEGLGGGADSAGGEESTSVDGLIGFVFNILRFFILLIIGSQITKIINKVRNESDEWKDAAFLIGIIILLTTAADYISVYITGDVTATDT